MPTGVSLLAVSIIVFHIVRIHHLLSCALIFSRLSLGLGLWEVCRFRVPRAFAALVEIMLDFPGYFTYPLPVFFYAVLT